MSELLIGIITLFALLAAAAAMHFYRRLQQRETALQEANLQAARLQEQSRQQQEVQDDLTAARSQLSEAQARISGLEAELKSERENTAEQGRQRQAEQEELKTTRRDLSEGKARISKLETELENERKSADEKLQLLQSAKGEMEERFKNLAQEILEEKGKKFSEDSQQQLKPLRESMDSFRKKIEELHTENTKERTALQTHIQQLRDDTGAVSTVAENLINAFKGSSKTQGVWGEEMLLRLLENSGLQEGDNYVVQASHQSEDGKRQIPDVIIRLPEDKHLIIDAKVSTVAYLEYSEADDEDSRAATLQRHLASVKNHVDTLHEKNYSDLKNLNSPDFVLMFMSPESAYILALQEDNSIFTTAYDKKVIITGATTLMPILRTVANIWQLEKQQQHAQDIAAQGGKLYDKIVGFWADMEALGRALDSAQKKYGEAKGKLKDGRGSALTQAEQLRKMGVTTNKKLPPEALTLGLTEEEEAEVAAAEEKA